MGMWAKLLVITLCFYGVGAAQELASDEAANRAPRYALVIGNSDYKHLSSLPNVARDATEMTHTLELLRFSVTPVQNLSRTAMDKAVADFVGKVPEGAIVWVYYSGHGMERSSDNFLFPIDAPSTSEGRLYGFSLDNELIKPLSQLKALATVVVIDACREPSAISGGAGGMAKPLGFQKPSDRGIEPYLIAFSAQPRQTVDADNPYAEKLRASMLTQGLRLEAIFNKTHDDVLADPKNVNKDQNPQIYGSLAAAPIYLLPPDRTVEWGFGDVPTKPDRASPDGILAAGHYLEGHGMSLVQVSKGEVSFVNTNVIYNGVPVTAAHQNVLTQLKCDGEPVSFTLRLQRQAKKISVRRAILVAATASGVTHPKWEVRAFDSDGGLLSSGGEALLGEYGQIPANTVDLVGPAIQTLTVSADYRAWDARTQSLKPFAGFCSVLIESLTITYGPTVRNDPSGATTIIW